MPEFDAAIWFLAATTCFAAFVNGAIGYGFSSLTVPFALVFYTNRILNPAIVIIEVFVNGLAPPYRSKLADRPAVRVDAGRSLFATIYGSPIAMLFNNQGLVKHEFRAGLALVRVVESSVTAFVYYQLGLFIYESGSLLYIFVPVSCLASRWGPTSFAGLIRRYSDASV